MKNSSKSKSITSFPKNFWTAISMEFFKRESYYGVMSVLSVYLVLSKTDGGLGFSKESKSNFLQKRAYIRIEKSKKLGVIM